MEFLEKMSREQLTDLLAEKTNQYLKFLKEGSQHKDFVSCKKTIDLLTAEIKRRKNEGTESRRKSNDG